MYEIRMDAVLYLPYVVISSQVLLDNNAECEVY